MRVSEIMAKDPATVTPDTSLVEAAKLMKDEDVGILPVVESQGSSRLVGIVTDRDIAIRHVAAGHSSTTCAVREAMSEGVRTASADDSVDEVMRIMGREQVRRLPIVDERGGLLGIVSQADLVLKGDDTKAAGTIEQISEPSGKHSQ
ncbi:MAG: CBS domain-containing protein [Gemmatimonadaceae bacterium]